MAGSLAGKTIIAHSRMVGESLAAAETLEGEGVSVEVLDLRSIAPWDREMVIESVSRPATRPIEATSPTLRKAS